MKFFKALALAALLALVSAPLFAAPNSNGANGTGSCTRPANVSAYSNGTLFGCSGTTLWLPITITGTNPQPDYVVHAMLSTTGTGASGAQYQVHLFSKTPVLTALSDRGAYVGPFAADFPYYLGSLICKTMQPTSDGTAQYWTECSTSNLAAAVLEFPSGYSTIQLAALVEVTTGYTPISGEVLSLWMFTSRGY